MNDSTEQGNLAEQQLMLIRQLDDVQDDAPELRDFVRASLRVIKTALGSTNSFVAYWDEYARVRSKTEGPATSQLTKDIEQLFEVTRNKYVTEKDTGFVFEQPYFAVPMIPGGHFLGILGITQKDSPAKDQLASRDEPLLRDAARMIDTGIVLRCKHQVDKDVITVQEELDRVRDRHHANLDICLKAQLQTLLRHVESTAAFIFDVEPRQRELIAADDHGKRVWRVSRSLRVEIEDLVDECQERGSVISREYADDRHDLLVGGKPIQGIAGRWMATESGDVAGTLVVASYWPLVEPHKRLIDSAAAAIDSVIVGKKLAARIAANLRAFVDTDVIDILIDHPEWLEPRKEDVVVLSADLVGSTQYAQAEPDAMKVFENINAYLGMIGKIIKKEHKGTLDKYIGDEVMGIFGAPIKDPDCAQKAVECALTIMGRVERLNAERKANGLILFEVKTTLGFVNGVVGEVGSRGTQTDYTVIGSSVSEFFRIAAHAIPGKIIINEALRRELGGRYETELVNEVNVKGVDRKLPIYLLYLRQRSQAAS